MIGAFGTTLFLPATRFSPIARPSCSAALSPISGDCWSATLILGVWAHLAGMGLGGVALGWFLASGLVGFGLGGVAMFQALPRLGSNLAMLIVQCGSALVATVGEWLWLDAKLTPLQIGFILITLVGVAVGLLPRSLPVVPKGVLRAGVAWALLSAVGQGSERC